MYDILIVEDHADSRRALAKLLTICGFRITEAEGYHSAISALQQRPFDLLISDLELPDGNGCDLLKAMRALPGGSRLAGIAVTGYRMPDDVRRCQDAGFAAHFLKPIHFERLRQTVAQVLPSPRRTPVPSQNHFPGGGQRDADSSSGSDSSASHLLRPPP